MLLDLLGPPGLAGGAVADFHFSDIPVRGDDGARAIGANDDAAAVEPRGRRRQHPLIESRPRWYSQCRALSPDFPAGARGLYPLARGCRIRPARGMAPALMVCWIAGGAGFFLFGVIAWRRRRATGSIAAGTWRRRPSVGWQR
jgi:hypothetical protein